VSFRCRVGVGESGRGVFFEEGLVLERDVVREGVVVPSDDFVQRERDWVDIDIRVAASINIIIWRFPLFQRGSCGVYFRARTFRCRTRWPGSRGS